MIDFLESRHEYRVGGRLLPSVTRVIVGVGLMYVSGDEEAMMRGRAVHEATRMLDKGTLILRSVDPSIAGYVESWVKLRTSKKFRIVSAERKVACGRYGFAGRYDNEIVIDGERAILEKKSGDIQELPARLQLAAYAEARRIETRNKEPYGRIVARLFPDGDMAHVEMYSAMDYQRDLGGFLSALNLYKLKEQIK